MVAKKFPEEKLAYKILHQNKLSIPFDLVELVSKYAKLSFESIPIDGVDGVSINLKTNKTHVIVNTRLPEKRQRFTLAHELGHVILPWHVGTIVDDIYSQHYKDFAYQEIEQEANRFAAALLMPEDWVLDLYKINNDIAKLHNKITEIADVSKLAAAIRLTQLLPPNILFASETNNIVLNSGKTASTNAFTIPVDDVFDSNYYPHIDEYSSYDFGSTTFHWWKVSTLIKIDVDENSTWRDILDKIIEDINPYQGKEKFKMSINGIFGSVNSVMKRDGSNYNIDTLTAASLYKMRRPELQDFISHPEFEKFIKRRVMDFFPQKKT